MKQKAAKAIKLVSLIREATVHNIPASKRPIENLLILFTFLFLKKSSKFKGP